MRSNRQYAHSASNRSELPGIPRFESPNYFVIFLWIIFAYTDLVFYIPEARLCDFTACCKGCRENIPAPITTMPDLWIVVVCPLCGERRAYLPI